MKTILLDSSVRIKLPAQRYPLISNVVRINDFNITKMKDRIDDLNYALFNQNMLVGLLQNLAIDPEWTLDYVINYTRLRSKSLCSAFKIITEHNVEGTHPNTIFYGNCNESFCLLDSRRDLTNISLYSLKSLVPIYSTITTYGYGTSAERERNSQFDYKHDFSLVGINLVELAVGWWIYMKSTDKGIHTYLATVVLPEFELLHNQLALFNALYEHVVNNIGYSQLLLGESLSFNTMKIRDDLIAMESFWVRTMKVSSWKTNLLLMEYLNTSMTKELPFLFNSEQYNLTYNPNVVWMFELTAVKYYQIYYKLINDLSLVPDSTSGRLKQLVPLVKDRWKLIKDPNTKTHALDMLNKLSLLNT